MMLQFMIFLTILLFFALYEIIRLKIYIRTFEPLLLEQSLASIQKKIDTKATDRKHIDSELLELERLIIKSKNSALYTNWVNEYAYFLYYGRELVKLESFISKQEKTNNVGGVVYLNAAILCIDEYENFNNKKLKEKGQKFIDKSLEMIPGYGEPIGVRLTSMMVDLARAENDIQKAEIKKECHNIFRNLIAASSPITAFEATRRIDKDRNYQPFKKYIDMLENLFKPEMDKLYAKAAEHRY